MLMVGSTGIEPKMLWCKAGALVRIQSALSQEYPKAVGRVELEIQRLKLAQLWKLHYQRLTILKLAGMTHVRVVVVRSIKSATAYN